MVSWTEADCQFAGLLPDGGVVIKVRGEEWPIELEGIGVRQPLPAGYAEIFERIARLGTPLRCTVLGELEGGRLRARLSCYGWQDKSGDVWLDLGAVLVEEGVAFPQPPAPPPG